eukprot:TRINITY_DN16627_c0_g2_i1.p1 TRINITY_DN16627_c0_g2~~TRINITY_DN16627_c0_g2_i1.p1  ORF type:complete len:445 (+),score=73.77 TRINITY_DN16627_c0_g2_i1:80-1414(+)
MIWYDATSWSKMLTHWEGTTIQSCWSKVLLFCTYVVACFAMEGLWEIDLGSAFKHSAILSKALCFLLVFRANSSYKRFWEGRLRSAEFYSNLRSLVMLACGLFRGGTGQYMWNRRCGEDGYNLAWKQSLDDDDDLRASKARTDIVRFAIAIAVGLKLHLRLSGSGFYDGELAEDDKWRLNWACYEWRVEETHEETQLLWKTGKTEPQVFHETPACKNPGNSHFLVSMEPCYRQLLVIINFLLMTVKLHANEPYGYKERFLPEFIKMSTAIMRAQDRVNTALCTPLPLPYVNLVRTLLIVHLLSCVFFMDHEEGVWANVVMPTMAAMALLGIDQIGTELENPFGNDANDLDIPEMISTFEKEMMRLLELSGDTRARSCFVWLPVPSFMQEESRRPIHWYVALKSQVQHVNVPKARGESGVRMEQVDAFSIYRKEKPDGVASPSVP